MIAAPEKCRDMPELCWCAMSWFSWISRPFRWWHVTFFGTYEPECGDLSGRPASAPVIAIDVGANVAASAADGAPGGPAARAGGRATPGCAALGDNVSINRLSRWRSFHMRCRTPTRQSILSARRRKMPVRKRSYRSRGEIVEADNVQVDARVSMRSRDAQLSGWI